VKPAKRKNIRRAGKPDRRVSRVRKEKTGSAFLYLLRRGWWILRGAAVGVMVLAGLYGCYLGIGKVLELDSISVRVVEVDGCRSVRPEIIRKLAGIEKGYPLLKVDLDKVRQRVITHPSVKDATVVRELPGILRISVVERTPAAVVLDGVFYMVDAEGMVMGIYDSYPGDYPVITGIGEALEPGKKVPEFLPALDALQSISVSGLLGRERISELRVDGELIRVYLTDGGTVLVLGAGDKGAQIGKLARLMEAGVFDTHIGGYDLRFQGRVISMPDRKVYAGG